MNKGALIFSIFLLFFQQAEAFSNPCRGRGTTFIFGNGMFNTLENAIDSGKELESLVQGNLNYQPLKGLDS